MTSNGTGLTEALAVWVRGFVQRAAERQLRELATGGIPLTLAVARGEVENQAYRDVVDGIRADADLGRIATRSGQPGPVVYPPFAGVQLNDTALPAGLLAGAALEHLATGRVMDNDGLAATCVRNLECVRSIAGGRPTTMLVLTGLAGLNLAPSTRVQTDLGTLTPVVPDLLFALGSPEPTLMAATPMSVRVPVQEPGGAAPGIDRPTEDAIRRMAAQLSASLLLSLEATEPRGRPRVTGLSVVVPFEGWTSSMVPGQLIPPGRDREDSLTDDEIARVKTYSEVLAAEDGRSITIALERMHSAAIARVAPADVLIDAVTAWENIVGTSSESSFRVTSALAWLIGDAGHDARRALQRKLNSAYRVRSAVVHGGYSDSDSVVDAAGTALWAAMAALRRLLSDERWLLEFHSSTQRADALLLGDPRR